MDNAVTSRYPVLSRILRKMDKLVVSGMMVTEAVDSLSVSVVSGTFLFASLSFLSLPERSHASHLPLMFDVL
jgi:hypothetical protein